jgi:hypothetical protein
MKEVEIMTPDCIDFAMLLLQYFAQCKFWAMSDFATPMSSSQVSLPYRTTSWSPPIWSWLLDTTSLLLTSLLSWLPNFDLFLVISFIYFTWPGPFISQPCRYQLSQPSTRLPIVNVTMRWYAMIYLQFLGFSLCARGGGRRACIINIRI